MTLLMRLQVTRLRLPARADLGIQTFTDLEAGSVCRLYVHPTAAGLLNFVH